MEATVIAPPVPKKSTHAALWIGLGLLILIAVILIIVFVVIKPGKSSNAPNTPLIPFCPDVTNIKFNPNGCENHSSTKACLASVNANYTPDDQLCTASHCGGATGKSDGCACILDADCASLNCVIGRCQAPIPT